uniref:Putative subtilisin-like serine protease n=1 Tax=Phlebotomus kandelakii TaxID=1109342 RepID=A0A6B2ELK5_9DIPT
MTGKLMWRGVLVALQLSICAAMPITNGDTVRSGTWSTGTTVLFAVLSFMGIGTLLGACLCCRPRKRGFEEFKNETPGNVEAPRTEYPIFGALATNHGGDFEETSPANHAGAVQTANICTTNGSHSPPLIVNVNEMQANHIYSPPINHDFDNNNGPISPADMENIENNNAGDYIANRNEIGVVVEPSINAINRNIVNSAPAQGDAIVHESCVVLDIEEVSGVPNTQSDSDSMLPVISTKSQSFLENLDLRTAEFTNVNAVSPKDNAKDFDAKSTDSGESESSGNSEIEEALMALHFAIADEDTCDANDDEDCSEATYEDVLKNLMVENVESNGECKYHADIDEIEAVAIKLVDSVLEESEKVVDGMKKMYDTFDLLEKSTNSLEETFFMDIQSNKFLQSTPCFTNKVTHIDSIANQRVLFDGEISSPEVNPGATFTKSADGIFVCESDANGPTIVIEKEKDDVISVDLTTITPVNTPIEINSAYTVDSWYPQPSTSKAGPSGWFLHPQKEDTEVTEHDSPKGDETLTKLTGDGTFEVLSGDEDEEEENARNLDVTFDALRRQLEQVLPHAQGMVNPINFSDDEENFQENPEVFPDFAIEGASNVQTTKEIIINYQRRPLSPIAEESEDETTCKTFIMNEAKNQDSTSTGCIETGEAIMGVSKNLMASNDTLFNFEDTLGDRDDQFSPLVEKRNFPNDMVSPVEPPEKRNMNLELNLTKTIEVNDLCSPEAAKTFSEDHMSSDHDPDATCTTNTIEGETCISVAGIASNTFVEDDERISEISEPDWNSDLTSTDVAGKDGQEVDRNSLLDVDDIAVEDLDNALSVEPVNGERRQLSETESDNDTVKEDKEPSQASPVKRMENGDESENRGDTPPHNSEIFQAKDTDVKSIARYEGNRKSPPPTSADTKVDANHVTLAADVLVKDLSNKFWSESAPIIYSKHHPIANYNIYEIADYDGIGEESGVILSEGQCLSGEEDPWSSPVMSQNALADIRYSVPACEMMTTSFNGDDWDSDDGNVDEDDSSEEFMYLKGLSAAETEKMYEKEVEKEHSSLNGPCESDIWTTHKDKVPVHRSLDNSDSPPLNSEDCSSDVEGEFIPSCWDSMALPARSAMKSPDKSSSGKNRRNVIFKVQMYHSVYEYPREVVPLSPAYSEPKVWNHHRDNLQTSKFNAEAIDLDGFMVSSSTRPFHNSQFQAQCNTWPSDSDFSWSQLQDAEDEDVKYTNYSSMPLDWPKSLSDLSRQEESLRGSDHVTELQDSEAVSAEQCESTSLGDLCHQKPLLRLPLTTVNVSTIEEEEKNVEAKVEEGDNFILPTPSCTGSMDSLSSSSGSDQPSFTTFGKTNQSESFEDSLTSSRDGSGDGGNAPEAEMAIDREDLINEVERRSQKVNHERSTRISDSTDEDSGIESVSRIIK